VVVATFVIGSSVFSNFTLTPSTHVSLSTKDSSSRRFGPSPAATSDTVSKNGVSPTTLSLTWVESGDLCFSSYALQESTSGSDGPWTTLETITSISFTSEYIYGLSPSATEWWQIIDSDCLGSQASNQLQVTQSAAATLTYTQPTGTSAQFGWNNHAQYGGFVAFDSYQLKESVNGGTYSTVATVTSESTLSYTVNGLSSGTSYSFALVTTDECSGCSSGTFPSPSASNYVSFGTAVPLSASASASPTSADIGQTVAFSCAPAGGVSPYTFSWTFGDGQSGSGQYPSHSYAGAGSHDATCTVTDHDSSTAAGGVIVSVDSDPSVTTPTPSAASADVGQQITFSTTASGGSGGYVYTWTGLPAGCSTADSPVVVCVPTAAGSRLVTASVTDSNGFTDASSSLSYTVAVDPTITQFVATPAKLLVGQSLALVASVTGGNLPYTYSYSGLPAGCTSIDSLAISCNPTTAGNFEILVTVTDSVGESTSEDVNVTVGAVFLGLPATEGYVLLGGTVAAVAVGGTVGGLLILRRRRPT